MTLKFFLYLLTIAGLAAVSHFVSFFVNHPTFAAFLFCLPISITAVFSQLRWSLVCAVCFGGVLLMGNYATKFGVIDALGWVFLYVGLIAVLEFANRRAKASLYQSLREREINEDRMRLVQSELEDRVLKRTNEISRAIAALSESESHMRAVFENAAEGIFTVDQNGIVLSFNPSAQKIFGIDAAAILGQNIQTLFCIPSQTTIVEYFCSILATLAKPSEKPFVEVWGVKSDRTTFPMELSVSEISLNTKHYFSGIVRDITERKNNEQELLHAKQVADEASQAKSRFLANISHELRTPLGAILGLSEILSDHAHLQTEDRLFVKKIKRHAELLVRIVNDLLDLSKAEADKLEVESIRIDLQELVFDVFHLLEPKATQKKLKFSLMALSQVPRFVCSDPLRLRQILLNLMGNAIKFTDRGEICLSVDCRKIEKSTKVNIFFLVSDSGRGISESEAERLFQPFVQADVSISRNYGGSGLGLVLAKKFAEALGGEVVLTRSARNQGSVFQVSIVVDVLAPFEFVKVLDESLQESQTQLPPVLPLRLDGKRILLVDDAPDNRFIIGKMLSALGAVVETAIDGGDALKKALCGMHDVVLMDIQMPVLDGYQATTELRRCNYQTPIIALTAHAMKEDLSHCLKAGCNDFLTKPVTLAQLSQKINEHI